jgi:O-antigen/teichoic acid export membrane protein
MTAGNAPGATPDAHAAARGTVSLFVLQTIGRVLGVGFVVSVARSVAPSEFGRYSIVTGIVVFASTVADFGITPVLIRSVSRKRDDAEALLAGTLLTSFAIGLIAYAISIAFVVVAGYPQQTVWDTVIGAAALPLMCVVTSILGALDGAGLIAARAGVTLLQVVVVTLGGATPVVLGADIRVALAAFALAPALGWVAGTAIARRERLWSGRIGFSGERSRQLLRLALPFAILAGLGAVYRRFDLLVLSRVGTRTEVADYDIALRVIEAVGYLGTVLSAPALFILSRRVAAGDRDGAQRAFAAACRAAYLIGLPASAGLVALHTQLVAEVFGPRYAGAGVLVAILGAQMWLDFVNTLQGAVIVATDTVRAAMTRAAVVMGILTVLDVVLIIEFGATGAAVALAAFQVINVAVFRSFNARTADVRTPWPQPQVLISTVACGVAAAVVVRWSLPLAVVAGGAAYVALLSVTGGVQRADLALLRRAGASAGTE